VREQSQHEPAGTAVFGPQRNQGPRSADL